MRRSGTCKEGRVVLVMQQKQKQKKKKKEKEKEKVEEWWGEW